MSETRSSRRSARSSMVDPRLAVDGARRRSLAVVVVVIAIGGLVVFPLFELVRGAVGDAGSSFGDVIASPELRRPAFRTLTLGAMVTTLALILAVAAVLTIERSPRRMRRWLRVGVLLPLLVPPFVSALSWVSAYGEGGLLDDLTGVSLPGLFGAAGVVLVVTINAVPLAYLVVAAALAGRADADLELAARVSGARPATVLRTITLPALTPAIVAAGALVFVIAINAFGIPAVLGTPAGFTTVTTRIYQDLAFSADPVAFSRVLVLASLLVLTTLIVVGGADATARLRRSPIHRIESPSALAHPPRRRDRHVAIMVALYALAATVVPMVALALTAVTPAAGVSPAPGNWTTANFAEAWSGGVWRALGNSVGVSALAAVMVVVLAGSAHHRRTPEAGVSARHGCCPHVCRTWFGAGSGRAAGLRPLAARYGSVDPRRVSGEVLGAWASTTCERDRVVVAGCCLGGTGGWGSSGDGASYRHRPLAGTRPWCRVVARVPVRPP